MAVKNEAEKFRVGTRARKMERKVLILQSVIASISLLCIALSVVAQEISFYGTYSNALGGEWFLQSEQPPIPTSELWSSEDSKFVLTMKFMVSKLTIIQIALMVIQFKIITSIMIEQKQLDSSAQDPSATFDASTSVFTLTSSFGYSSSYFLLFQYLLELAICSVHPPPFIKKKFITTIVGREAIYNIESLVCPTLPNLF